MSEILNSKQEILNKPKIQNQKQYNLGERTFRFTERVIVYINNLPETLTNTEISKQLIRAAGSIGANYLEAEESLSKRDFVMRIKISRKEAKECGYWLQLSDAR